MSDTINQEVTISAPGAAGVIARLAAKEEARRADRAQRLEQLAARSDPREDVDRYLSWFSAQQSDLAAKVAAAAAGAAALGGGAASEARRELQGQLDDALSSIADLEKSTSTASYYLPSYDLKRSAAALQELRQAVQGARAALQPRRKFAFSSRAARPAAAPAASAAAAAAAGTPCPDEQQGEQQQQQGVQQGEQQEEQQQQQHEQQQNEQQQQQDEPSAYDLELVASGRGLRGLRNQVVVVRAAQLAGREFVLIDLEGCSVFLLGEMAALRAARLTGCRVVAGPVVGAAFVDGAEGCSFALAAQQVRLHRMSRCDLHLRVKSRPIIEACCGLRFAPLPEGALGPLGLAMEGAAEACGLCLAPGEDDGGGGSEAGSGGDAGGGGGGGTGRGGAGGMPSDMWRRVDDFGWVKATRSPNWDVLPEGERAAALRRLAAPLAEAGSV